MTDTDSATRRDAIIARYSGLARTALAGETITDCDPDTFADGRPLGGVASCLVLGPGPCKDSGL